MPIPRLPQPMYNCSENSLIHTDGINRYKHTHPQFGACLTKIFSSEDEPSRWRAIGECLDAVRSCKMFLDYKVELIGTSKSLSPSQQEILEFLNKEVVEDEEIISFIKNEIETLQNKRNATKTHSLAEAIQALSISVLSFTEQHKEI